MTSKKAKPTSRGSTSHAREANGERSNKVLALAQQDNGIRAPRLVVAGLPAGSAPVKRAVPARAPERRAVVDVIVPVFNALEHVKNCFASLQRTQGALPMRLIAVNDGSDAETRKWLRGQAKEHAQAQFTLIEHAQNKGYTRSVNAALRVSSAKYVVLLNSDTIVTCGWLERLIACAESSPSLGIVGPLSNAASWQSIPRVKDARGFVVNELPEGMSPDDVAALVAERSARCYPRTPFVNGFCFMIRRDVVDRIGLFDEKHFPFGYGEENDYCMRAGAAGFELAIADDAYVFHAKSKSFGHERRKQLSDAGSKALRQKHGVAEVTRLIERVKGLTALEPMRRELDLVLGVKSRAHVPLEPLSLKILFLLPAKGGGGGVNSIVQEVGAMRRLGIDARIMIRKRDQGDFSRTYADVADLQSMLAVHPQDDALSVAQGNDIVVATVNSSVDMLARIAVAYPEILPAYYAQDYEPLFFETGSISHRIALESYNKLPNALVFAKTQWIAKTIEARHGVKVVKVKPSLDHQVYYPAARARDGVVRIAAMVRPQTPRRGAERTMRILARVFESHRDRVAIHLFGCQSDDPRFQALEQQFQYINYGLLTRPEVAQLLRQSDVFVDFSDYQAFGRTALEAMACNCAVLVPAEGGSDEYAVHRENALVVDTSNEDACVSALSELVADDAMLIALRRAGLLTAARYSVHQAAVSEIDVLSTAANEHRRRHPLRERAKLALSTSRTNGGEIAGSGYVRLSYPWRVPGVRRYWTSTVLEPGRLPEPGEAEVAILQRQPSGFDLAVLADWLSQWRHANGKLLVDVDDHLLDQAELERRGVRDPAATAVGMRWVASAADALLVSTESLRQDYAKINPNVFVIPNALDRSLWRIGAPPITEPQYQKKPGDPVRLGYIGTGTHDADLAILTNVVARLQQKYGDAISVEVVGAFERRTPLWGRRIGLPRSHVYPDFVHWCQKRISWDIGVIPLVDDPFCTRKSHVKFLEYSALGLASVCSNVPAYNGTVIHERTGLLVENDDEQWFRALCRLIDDSKLRERIARAAFDDLERHHTTDANVDLCIGVLDAVRALPRRSEPLLLPAAFKRPNAPRPDSKANGERPKPAAVTTSGTTATAPLVKPSRSEQPRWKRKLRKLRRDPTRFVEDSRSPVVKLAGKMFGISR